MSLHLILSEKHPIQKQKNNGLRGLQARLVLPLPISTKSVGNYPTPARRDMQEEGQKTMK